MTQKNISLREQAEQLGAGLPPLLVDAEKLASAVNLGAHGRRRSGIGETYWQFRRYQTEDAASAIDWRQSAKSEHLFVREREWEVTEAVWLRRDDTPSMRFHSEYSDVTKRDRATVLALALASLLIRGGERVGVDGDNHPPSSGRATLHRIAHALINERPAASNLDGRITASKHAQFVWFSDFLSPLEEIGLQLRRLVQNGLDGHLIHIVDPAEEDFPYTGRLRFEDAGGKDFTIFGRAESVQTDYRNRFRAHADGVRDLARRLGWSYLAHRTDKSPQTALIATFANIGGSEAKMRIA